MSGVNSAPVMHVPLMWAALAVAVLSVLVLAGLWLAVRRLQRARGRAPVSVPGGREMAAIILLLIGGFFSLVGWVVGAVLLWTSPRWRFTDKLLGTVVWPGGLSLIWYVGALTIGSLTCRDGLPARCTWTRPSLWVGTMALVVMLVGQLATPVWLWWRAARSIPGHDANGASVTPAA